MIDAAKSDWVRSGQPASHPAKKYAGAWLLGEGSKQVCRWAAHENHLLLLDPTVRVGSPEGPWPGDGEEVGEEELRDLGVLLVVVGGEEEELDPTPRRDLLLALGAGACRGGPQGHGTHT